MSVSASNNSSNVPNPPGKMMNADEYLMNIVFRTKKYRKLISVSTYGFAPCSNGSSMLQPIDRPCPMRAPLLPASMMPGPAPVMIANPTSANNRAVSFAAAYCGSSGPTRADPNKVTAFSTVASVSKPSMNSDMMRINRHGSVRVKSFAGNREPARNNFSSSVMSGGM